MNQNEIDHARGHFLIVEDHLASMLFEVRSAIRLMPYLEWYQVALINSYVYDSFCKVREQLLNLGNYTGAQATGKGLPAKTAASAASMECPCLCIVDR